MWYLFVAAAAQAGDLSWDWSSSPVRYHAESVVTTHTGFEFVARENAAARAVQTVVVADITCKGERGGKRVFDVDCTVDRVLVQGQAFEGEQDRLDAIFNEYEEILTGATLQLEIRNDGHIRLFDLEGIEKHQGRWEIVHEDLRQLLRRVFSPMGVQMPKNGDDPGKEWKHKGTPPFLEILFKEQGSMSGGSVNMASGAAVTAGGTVYKYEVVDERGGTVFVQGGGRGNVSTGAQLDSSGNLGVNLTAAGQLRFDPAAHHLAYSEIAVSGIANNTSVSVGKDDRYNFAGWVGRINADGSIEGLVPGEPPASLEQPPAERMPQTETPRPPVDDSATPAPATPATTTEPPAAPAPRP